MAIYRFLSNGDRVPFGFLKFEIAAAVTV